MKKIIFLLVMLPIFCVAQYKTPERFVNTSVHDYISLLTPEQITNLDGIIAGIRQKSSTEVAVVLLPDLQGYDIADVGLAIGRDWGVGKKGVNNGLVYILCPSLRKARIEVGLGLEGDLTDVWTGSIQNNVKHFYKDNNYYEGILEVVQELDKKLTPVSPEILAKQKEQEEKRQKEIANIFKQVFIWTIFISLFIAIVLFGNYFYKKSQERKRLAELQKEQERLENVKAENYRQKVLSSVEKTKSTIIKDFDGVIKNIYDMADVFAKYEIDKNTTLRKIENLKQDLITYMDVNIPADIKDTNVNVLNEYHEKFSSYMNSLLMYSKKLVGELKAAKDLEMEKTYVIDSIKKHLEGTPNLYNTIMTEMSRKKGQYDKYGITVNTTQIDHQLKSLNEFLELIHKMGLLFTVDINELKEKLFTLETYNQFIQNQQKNAETLLSSRMKDEVDFRVHIKKIDDQLVDVKRELEYTPYKKDLSKLLEIHNQLKSAPANLHYSLYGQLITLITQYDKIIQYRPMQEAKRREEEERERVREQQRLDNLAAAKRKRQQEEEEEEERRRRRRNSSSSYGSSSYGSSSYGSSSDSSSSSSSSSTDYGGGSFGGGGSSSDF